MRGPLRERAPGRARPRTPRRRRAGRRPRWPPWTVSKPSTFTRPRSGAGRRPRARSRTRCATRSRSRQLRRGGHSTNAIRSGVEVVVEQRRVLARERARAGRGRGARPRTRALVEVADREGGAGHRALHAERAAGAAHERGLAAAELAAHQHHVARARAGPPAPRRPPRSPRRSRSRSRTRGSAARVLGSSRRGPSCVRDRRLRAARGSPPRADALGGSGGASASSAGSRAKSSRSCSLTLPACAAPRPGGRAGRAAPSARPISCTCGRAVHARDAAVAAGEQLGGEVAERADHPRLDQLDLARRGRACRPRSRRAGGRGCPGGRLLRTLVMNTSSRAQPDLLEQLVEQLARPAHERQPLLVLLGARAPRPRTSGRRRRCPAPNTTWCGSRAAGSRVQSLTSR